MTIEQILEAIEGLTILELNELVKAAEEKFGVSAAAPVVMAGGAAAGGDAAPAAEEQSEFEIVLQSVGNEKVKVIKVVKDITGLGLKDAKALVDEAPKTIKENVSKEDAEKIKAQLEEVGASVELK